MIGFLSGIARQVKSNQALILVNGVGYLVNLDLHHGLVENSPAELFIHTHVREDALTLFGFKDEIALNLFEKLLSVSGIGPKSALNILSSASVDLITKAISSSNLTFFTSISGIGKKGAQKIILDLKPKISLNAMSLKSLEGNSDLNSALVQLGFSQNEIVSVLTLIDYDQPLAAQIKQALQLLKS